MHILYNQYSIRHVWPGIVEHLSPSWASLSHFAIYHTKYKKGSIVSIPYELSNSFGYIQCGRLCSRHISYKGNERTILILGEKTLFRETYVNAGFAVNFPIHTCLSDTEIYLFSGKLLQDKNFLLNYPEHYREVCHSISVKLSIYDSILGITGCRSAIEKLSSWIFSCYQMHTSKIITPHISQIELSLLLGISQSSLNRATAILKRENIIKSFTKSRIEIVDVERLIDISEGNSK